MHPLLPAIHLVLCQSLPEVHFHAIFGLREVPNKDRLEELLGKVEAMDLSSYSEETANAVKAAVAMAAAVMEDENANQKQVDLAVTALEEAVAGLEAKEEAALANFWLTYFFFQTNHTAKSAATAATAGTAAFAASPVCLEKEIG